MKQSIIAKDRIGIYIPGHPGANNRGYILRARWIMEQYLGRPLESHEHVHHVNGNKTDDRLENLQILSPSEHGALHGGTSGGGRKRQLDYEKIAELLDTGLGYSRIAKALGYKMYSVKYAVRVIRREYNDKRK